MKPKVLITGANGFTGRNFCLYLARKGVPTRGMYWEPEGRPDIAHENLELVPGDLRDRASLKPVLEGIEIVQNVAALYRPTNIPQSMYWDVNVEGVRNIMELSAQAGVKRFVQCSTIGVHGNVKNPPAAEDAPIAPDDYSQSSKLKGEELALELGPKLKLPVVVIRPAAIYGRLEDRFLKLAKLIKSGRFIMFGSGEVPYHFIHVDDLSEAFILAAEKDEAVGEIFIIADERALSINEVTRIIADELDVPPPRIRLPYNLLFAASAICEFACKPFGVSPPLHRRRAAWFNSARSFDIGKARRILGYDPKIKPEDGLRQMARSYVDAGWL